LDKRFVNTAGVPFALLRALLFSDFKFSANLQTPIVVSTVLYRIVQNSK